MKLTRKMKMKKEGERRVVFFLFFFLVAQLAET